MQFTAKEDLSAPIGQVFDFLSDPDRLERVVRQRGGKIKRVPLGPVSTGTRWDAEIAFRGATRKVSFVLERMREPELMAFKGGGASFDISVRVELVALGPATTRLCVITEGTPKTLSARLMLKSMKLARGRMLTRYRQRISDYAAAIEKENRLG